ncbi:hypothetical protein MTR67_041258 [Solanum verrucosum]|uniref:F-box domain-containing protein n=1 Tax=Solanum verrucosum TaxID=315347 RepID=A0AAF0UK23_SOLVR|nr:F-box/kelch-repeat protein At3g23880-like [Solanum verrucosum]WMV47873.1 hypothetical protein MTR67_041258 [Solanum verrucosum]
MESRGDEVIPRHPKRSKPTNPAHFSSILSQDSVLPMPNLPTELILEILLKLPVKSLLQFRSVSKSWLSLISSPEFVKAHLSSSASNKNYTHHGVMVKVSTESVFVVKDCSLRSLLYHPVTEAFDLDYPGKSPNHYLWFVGVVNGLICFSIRLFDGLYDLFLWNPSIRKYKKLPNFRLDVSRRYYLDGHVNFKFGFAYNELQDDYKVVGIFPIYTRGHLSRVEVKIYSLKRDSWRCIDDFRRQELLAGSAKFVNGKLHWLDKQWNIISIDLADEKWAELERPSCFKQYVFLKLGVLGGDLSASYIYASSHADVWVMKEYGVKESWTKIFTTKSPGYPMTHPLHPTILTSNEGELLCMFGGRLMKYNTKDNMISYLDVTNFGPCLEAEIYVESLICPFSQQG